MMSEQKQTQILNDKQKSEYPITNNPQTGHTRRNTRSSHGGSPSCMPHHAPRQRRPPV